MKQEQRNIPDEMTENYLEHHREGLNNDHNFILEHFSIHFQCKGFNAGCVGRITCV